MKFLIYILFFIAILIPLILGIVIPIYKNHNEVTGGIINYDSTMRKFVYKIDLSSQEIIDLLNKKNVADELSCSFDLKNSVIRFTEYGSHRDYFFKIQEFSDFSILRLEQVALLGMQSSVPYKLNPYIVSKLNAEIVPFSQYRF